MLRDIPESLIYMYVINNIFDWLYAGLGRWGDNRFSLKTRPFNAVNCILTEFPTGSTSLAFAVSSV